MTVLLGVIFAALVIALCLTSYRGQTILRRFFLPALFFKLIAGLGVGMIYNFYYKNGDTLVFFSDGLTLANFARTNAWDYIQFLVSSSLSVNESLGLIFNDDRAIFMCKVVSLFCLVGFNNYWLVTLYISLLAFFGSWSLVKQIHKFFPAAGGSALIAFLFFPSIVFWTSGVIKETIAMAGLYFISGVCLKIWFRDRIALVTWLMAILSAYLLWRLKYYFAGVFFAILGATIVYRFITLYVWRSVGLVTAYLIWVSTLLILILSVTFLHPNFRHDKLLSVMVHNYHEFHRFSKPGSAIAFHDLEPTMNSLVRNSPEALFAGLFRPLFFDAHNFLAVLVSIENTMLLILLGFALPHLRQLFTSGVGILLCAIVVYVILLAIFITLSTPNLGTLARYRVGYLPFFVFLILLVPTIAGRLNHAFRLTVAGDVTVGKATDQRNK